MEIDFNIIINYIQYSTTFIYFLLLQILLVFKHNFFFILDNLNVFKN